MGWSQPVVGKRARPSESDENNERSTEGDPNPSSDELKLHKKARESSPKRSPPIMDCAMEFQHRVPLSTMGSRELSNRPPVDTPFPLSSSSTPNPLDETSQSSSQFGGCVRCESIPRREEFAEESNALRAQSYPIPPPSATSHPAECSPSCEMPGVVRGVRVGRRGRLSPQGNTTRRRLLPSTPSSTSTTTTTSASTTDTSSVTGLSSTSSTASSENGSEETEVDTDLDDQDEGEVCTEYGSTDFVPPIQVPTAIVPAIRPSYFPNVPPYINFCLHDQQCEALPPEIRKHLKWRLSTITPNIIKKTICNTGFRLLRKTVEWSGQWGKHMKAAQFRTALKDYQKLNHIPATFQIGRKDRLWRNFHKYMLKFGREEFGFLPRTYVLPQETKQLKAAWDSGDSKGMPWIVKPPAAARGTGIRVVNKWSQISKKRPLIVQKYISNPLLINERKFDLRLYVLVTSFHPLKVYLYKDGLVRFAPVKYSQDSKRVSDRFMHLTNYSVNKNCELYTHNEDANAQMGHKWTLKTLWRHLRGEGKNVDEIKEQIEDIVIKTLLCAEDPITAASHCLPNRYNGYELFGFDIILDHKMKPWLLEVNISPSLHSSSPLDMAVKGDLVKEVFNIAGYHLPSTLPTSVRRKFVRSLDIDLDQDNPAFDKRLYTCIISKEERAKHQTFKGLQEDRSKYLEEILETLTPDDCRILITAEDELSQCHGFIRIFPTPNSHIYFPFLEGPRYYNLLLDAWENAYFHDRATGIERIKALCKAKVHLLVTTSSKNAISESPTTSEEKLASEGGGRVDSKSNGGMESAPRAGDGDVGHAPSNYVDFNTSLSVNCLEEVCPVTRNPHPSPAGEFIKSAC